jgi:hypothetical protein
MKFVSGRKVKVAVGMKVVQALNVPTPLSPFLHPKFAVWRHTSMMDGLVTFEFVQESEAKLAVGMQLVKAA